MEMNNNWTKKTGKNNWTNPKRAENVHQPTLLRFLCQYKTGTLLQQQTCLLLQQETSLLLQLKTCSVASTQVALDGKSCDSVCFQRFKFKHLHFPMLFQCEPKTSLGIPAKCVELKNTVVFVLSLQEFRADPTEMKSEVAVRHFFSSRRSVRMK